MLYAIDYGGRFRRRAERGLPGKGIPRSATQHKHNHRRWPYRAYQKLKPGYNTGWAIIAACLCTPVFWAMLVLLIGVVPPYRP